jgi:catechol 2,3-dioxygenase-like lactoylglutathione lyase family enzyme
MDITIHASFLPHDDPDASLAFYRDALGFKGPRGRRKRHDALDHGRPVDQPYGVRDCAVRDPAGNLIRIQQLR